MYAYHIMSTLLNTVVYDLISGGGGGKKPIK